MNPGHHLAEVKDSRRQLLVRHDAYGGGRRTRDHLQRGHGGDMIEPHDRTRDL